MFDILSGSDIQHLLVTYGYLTVFLIVAVESMGLPLPGEMTLMAAGIYAGTTHHLSLVLVIVAAIGGAVLGDNIGYLVGRKGGIRLLRRYGRFVRLDEPKLRLAQHLFDRHGGKMVFIGRFLPVLRIWAGFLAGMHAMPWRRFLAFNAAGGIVWATVMGVAAYTFGHAAVRVGGIAGFVLAAVTTVVMIAVTIGLHRSEWRHQQDANGADHAPQAVTRWDARISNQSNCRAVSGSGAGRRPGDDAYSYDPAVTKSKAGAPHHVAAGTVVPRIHKQEQKMTRAALVLIMLAAAGMGILRPGTALAATPTVQTLSVNTTDLVPAGTLCPFDLTFTGTGSVTVTTYYDSNGTPIRQTIHGDLVHTLSGPAGSLTSNGPAPVHIDLTTGTATDTGNEYHFNLAGQGVVLAGTGRLVFDSSGNPILQTGYTVAPDRVAALCAALGP